VVLSVNQNVGIAIGPEYGNRPRGLRPDCPCDFRVRADIAEGRSEKDEQNKIAEDFLRSYSQTHK